MAIQGELASGGTTTEAPGGGSNLYSLDEIAEVDKAMVRVNLGDNPVLKHLGLDNTFKTIELTSNMNTAEVERSIAHKMTAGMTKEQTELINEQCMLYRLFVVRGDKPPRLMAADEKPWNTQRRTASGQTAKLLFRAHTKMTKDAAKTKRGAQEAMQELTRQRADFDDAVRQTEQLESEADKLAERMENLHRTAQRYQTDATHAAELHTELGIEISRLTEAKPTAHGTLLTEYGRVVAALYASAGALVHAPFDSGLIATLSALYENSQDERLGTLRAEVASAGANYARQHDHVLKKGVKDVKSREALWSASLAFHGLNRQYVSLLQDITSSGVAELEEQLAVQLIGMRAYHAAAAASIDAALPAVNSAVARIETERRTYIDRKSKGTPPADVVEGYLLRYEEAPSPHCQLLWYYCSGPDLFELKRWTDTISDSASRIDLNRCTVQPVAADDRSYGGDPFALVIAERDDIADIDAAASKKKKTKANQVSLANKSLVLRACDHPSFDRWLVALQAATTVVRDKKRKRKKKSSKKHSDSAASSSSALSADRDQLVSEIERLRSELRQLCTGLDDLNREQLQLEYDQATK
jgi:hypothetical protein